MELAAIRETDEWNKLDDQTWRRLFREHHLGPIDTFDLSTDAKLLRELNAKPLAAWSWASGASTRIRQVREQAAVALQPRAVRVTLLSTTLETGRCGCVPRRAAETMMKHIVAKHTRDRVANAAWRAEIFTHYAPTTQ